MLKKITTEKRKIKLNGNELDFTLRTSRRSKNLQLAIHGSGRVVVTRPWRLPESFVLNFIERKASWILEKLDKFKTQDPSFHPGGTELDYLRHKSSARKLILARVAYFNQYYNFTFKRILIKNQKTRWGSCSRDGNLNFNYKLVLLPPEVADYIVVHELCHLKEFNHSRKFWQLVAEALPDYKDRRKRLKGKVE